ncbi:MAG: protein translocase subunit SecD [Planctomycetes bacterium]|nr:protein translocase subunit SecD [Planctomycetota bacterium]
MVRSLGFKTSIIILLYLFAVYVAIPKSWFRELGIDLYPLLGILGDDDVDNTVVKYPALIDRREFDLDVDLKGGAILIYRIEQDEDIDSESERKDLQDKIDQILGIRESERDANDELRLRSLQQQLDELNTAYSEDDPVGSTIETLYRRLDKSGTSGIRISEVSGDADFDKIQVVLPGATDERVAQYDKLITSQGVLQFLIVAPKEVSQTWIESRPDKSKANDPEYLARMVDEQKGVRYKWFERHFEPPTAPPDEIDKEGWMEKQYQKFLDDPERRYILLQEETDPNMRFTGKDLDPDKLYLTTSGSRDGRAVIAFSLRPGRDSAFGAFTGKHTGEGLAILMDGEVYASPNINSRIDDHGILQGFDPSEQKRILDILRSGSIEVKLVQESKTFIGPTQGPDNIRKGMFSILLGLSLVLLFIAIYYWTSGLMAGAAMMMNIALIMGFLCFFNATVSLPGIAGLILTIGMAVDANILIFERIREELSRGVKLLRAIEQGYQRAFWTIFDANVTTLLCAVILYNIGHGFIRGFAVVLAVGILTSMFCAIFVTRLMMGWYVEGYQPQTLRMMQIVKDPKIDFMKIGNYFWIASIGCIVFGLFTFFTHGDGGVKNFGIEFRGGDQIHVQFREPMRLESVREEIVKGASFAGLANANIEVQFVDRSAEIQEAVGKLRADGEYQAGSNYSDQLIFMVPGEADEKRRTDFREAISSAFADRLAESGFSFEVVPVSSDKLSEVSLSYGISIEVSELFDRSAFKLDFLRALEADAQVRNPGGAEKPFPTVSIEGSTVSVSLRPLDISQTSRRASDWRNHIRGLLQKYILENSSLGLGPNVTDIDMKTIPMTRIDILGRFRVLTVDGFSPAGFIAELNKRLARYGFPKDVSIASVEEWNRVEGKNQFGERLNPMTYADARSNALSCSAKEAERAGNEFAFDVTLRNVDLFWKHPSRPDETLDYSDWVREIENDVRHVESSMAEVKQLLVDRTEFSTASLKANFKAHVVSLSPVSIKAFSGIFQDAEGNIDEEMLMTKFGIGFISSREFDSSKVVNGTHSSEFLIESDNIDFTSAFTPGHLGRKLKSEVETFLRSKSTSILDPILQDTHIDPQGAATLKNKAIWSGIIALIAIIVYIRFRFLQWRFGIAAVVALIHDVLFTLGAFGVMNMYFDMNVLINFNEMAALMTIIGYSLNDTIIVFDRVRENLQKKLKGTLKDTINRSVNETLSRTVLTSGTTFATVAVFYFFGGEIIRGFSLAMMIGIFVGTYSSIFIACTMVAFGGEKLEEEIKREAEEKERQRAEAAAGAQQSAT